MMGGLLRIVGVAFGIILGFFAKYSFTDLACVKSVLHLGHLIADLEYILSQSGQYFPVFLSTNAIIPIPIWIALTKKRKFANVRIDDATFRTSFDQ